MGRYLWATSGNDVAHATMAGGIGVVVSADDHEATPIITNPVSGKPDIHQLSHASYRGDDARHGAATTSA